MDEPEERVLLTDLVVVIENMLNGPAGMLRNCKLFPTATALVAMDQQEAGRRQALFPGQKGPPPTDQRMPKGAPADLNLSQLLSCRPSGPPPFHPLQVVHPVHPCFA
jgi:hypothetical protein